MDYIQIRDAVKQKLPGIIDYSRELTDEEVEEQIDELLGKEERLQTLPLKKRQKLHKEIFHAVRKLDFLQELVDDSSVTEIMINGTDTVFVEQNGSLLQLEEKFEEEKLADIIQQIVAGCNRVVNEASPVVDARLSNGSRVNIVMKPIALNGPIVTIRRFPDNPVRMKDLIDFGSITQEAAEFLKKLVQARYNIFISGGTGSGKTTFLNVLSDFIPGEERVITIEDSAELKIQNIPNLVRLETRNSNVEGCMPVTIRDLIKTALRMRPDRIVVGEVRGGEALDMLQAMNTGHDGSLSSGHANTAEDMLGRLETMVLMGMDLPLAAVKKQIASGIDILVHLGRLRDKTRKVLQIVEIAGFNNGDILTRMLYEFEEKGEDKEGKIRGKLVKRGEIMHEEKLRAAGIRI